MNFLNHTFAYEDLRDCTLITKNGTKIVVNVDSLEFYGDVLPKFEGHIMGIETTKVDNKTVKDVFDTLTEEQKNAIYALYEISTEIMNYIPEIKNVIFNDPATIVFWNDGTKTVVKCQPGDSFDPEKGLAMAITKKAYGNKGSYCNQLKKWLPKEEPGDSNDILSRIFETKVFPVNPDRNEFLTSFKKGISDAFDIILNETKCTPNDNSVSSKKRMTFREEEAKLHPENLNPDWEGGVYGCPRDMDSCPYSITSDDDCRACWDREIPDELMDNN